MLALLLAVAAGAAYPQCAGFGGSTSYSVQNAKGPATLAFTTEGEGVVAVCVGQTGPVGRTNGHVEVLDAFKGAVKNVTGAECDSTLMQRSGQSVVTPRVLDVEPGQDNASVAFLPLKDFKSFNAQASFGHIYSMGSNGDSTIVGGQYSGSSGFLVNVLSKQGYNDLNFGVAGVPNAVAVSNIIGGTFTYYVAVATSSAYGVYVAAYLPNQGLVDYFPLPAMTEVLALKFRDQGPKLVVVTVNEIWIYVIRNGLKVTYGGDDWYTASVAFNDDGSQMAVSGSQSGGVGGLPLIYMMDLETGKVQTLCQQEAVDKADPANNYASISFATDAHGHDVLLLQHQKDTTHLVLQAFQVPDVADAASN